MHRLELEINVSDVKPESWQDYGVKTVGATVGDVEISVRVSGIPENAQNELRDLRSNVSDLRADLIYHEGESRRKDGIIAELREKNFELTRANDPGYAKTRAEAKAMMARGENFIQAIKFIREATQLGLKDAKDICDEIRAEIARESVAAKSEVTE